MTVQPGHLFPLHVDLEFFGLRAVICVKQHWGAAEGVTPLEFVSLVAPHLIPWFSYQRTDNTSPSQKLCYQILDQQRP